jgi:ribosomal protein S18 acetylase RimI-like enzyme
VNDVIIQHGGLEHLDDLISLVDAYRQFYKQPTDVHAVRTYLQRRLEGQECIVLMAYQELEPLGFTLLYHHWTTVQLGHAWLLNDLFVPPPVRQRGIGRALMRAAFEFAEQDGAKRIWLRTATDNMAAQALYEKIGMKRDQAFYRYDFTFVHTGEAELKPEVKP